MPSPGQHTSDGRASPWKPVRCLDDQHGTLLFHPSASWLRKGMAQQVVSTPVLRRCCQAYIGLLRGYTPAMYSSTSLHAQPPGAAAAQNACPVRAAQSSALSWLNSSCTVLVLWCSVSADQSTGNFRVKAPAPYSDSLCRFNLLGLRRPRQLRLRCSGRTCRWGAPLWQWTECMRG